MTYSDKTVAVVIPWREQPSRRYAKHIVTDWYARNFPEFSVALVDTPDVPFNLAACRNSGVRSAAGFDVVIINDADTIPERDALIEAIEACVDSGVVHLPYNEYRSLMEEGTADYLREEKLIDCHHMIVDGAVSGVFVTTPRTWWTHGGQDEAFRGWGYEDVAWFIAHTTIIGKEPQRHEGRVYSLHHVSAVKEGDNYTENAARCFKYQMAQGDYLMMHSLVFGGTENA